MHSNCGPWQTRAGCSQTLQIIHEVASGMGHAWTTPICNRGSAHDFSVKLSPCVCVVLVAGEMATICQHIWSSENYCLTTYTLSCFLRWCNNRRWQILLLCMVCVPQLNIKSTMHYSLRLTPQWGIIWLVLVMGQWVSRYNGSTFYTLVYA